MAEGDRSLAVSSTLRIWLWASRGGENDSTSTGSWSAWWKKGKIVAKKAYADWSRFGPYTAPLHEAAIELVEIPKRAQTGKNSADIHLCVDAMDLANSRSTSIPS